MSGVQRLMAGAILTGLLVWRFSPALSSGFVFQDYRWTNACDTRPVKGSDLLSWTDAPRWLMRWSWCQQIGQSARSFHLVNLGLHLAVSIMLGVLLWRLTRHEPLAWIGAAIFALHPLVTESAVYLSGRSELIAAIGVLGACLSALSGWWIVALMGLGFGLMGKETAIVALGLVPLVLAMRSRQSRAWIVAGAATVASLTIFMAWQLSLMTTWASLDRWVLVQSAAVVRLSALSAMPLWGQTIAYDYALVPIGMQTVCMIAVVSSAIIAWRGLSYRTITLTAFGLSWMLLAVLPRFVMVTPYSLVLNEHQFYVPLMGWSFIVAGWAGDV